MSLPIDTCGNIASSQPPQGEDTKEGSPSETREFHQFSRLPPELRQQIWSLSIEPREFIFCPDYHLSSRFRNPALLDVCSESRDYVQKFHYAKYWSPLCAPFQYHWVNFDVDTVRLKADPNAILFAAQYPIQKLIVECRGGQMANSILGTLYGILGMLLKIPELRDVALVGLQSCLRSHPYRNRWLGWARHFEALYLSEVDNHRAQFDLRVVMPEHVEEDGPTELTLKDFLKEERKVVGAPMG